MSNREPSLSISLNGEALLTQSTTLEDLLVELGFAGRKVATAHNGDFVPERARAGTRLAAGDRIEVVSARQGG
jgi:sulfur carrier protein